MKRLILVLVLTATPVFAKTGDQGTFDQCVAGDCGPQESRERQCPPHSDRPHMKYLHPWVRNCYETREIEEKECSENEYWEPGVILTRGGKEKQCL